MRDNFSQSTKDTLAKRVGYICSNPECSVLTSGPRSEADKSICVGVAAHISAASPGGPRYDSALTSDLRRSVENGIWLCQNCAKLVDSDAAHFTAALLQQWKLRAEERAALSLKNTPLRKALGQGAPPCPPTPYVAHPYALLQTDELIGRDTEYERLDKWFYDGSSESRPVVCISAIGGVGKSALAWTWFNRTTKTPNDVAGSVWWSFYDTRGGYESFVTSALSYVTNRSLDIVRAIPFADQEAELLLVLSRSRYLIVLDGVERLLLAYARMDAPYREDHKANTKYDSLPYEQLHPYLTKTVSSRAGHFLRRLQSIEGSKTVITSRLLPAALEHPSLRPLDGVEHMELTGLSNEGAMRMWEALGGTGESQNLAPYLRATGNHPLLIQLLVHAVCRFVEDPGNFDSWADHHNFSSASKLPMREVHDLILKGALSDLAPEEVDLLECLSTFRLPADIESLKAVVRHAGSTEDIDVGEALALLEGRGLIGWNRETSRFDLHPIVRGFVFNAADPERRHTLNLAAKALFDSRVQASSYPETFDDLANAIELCYALTSLGEVRQAFYLYLERLSGFFRANKTHADVQAQIVERMFPDGLDSRPPMSSGDVGAVYSELGLAYESCGHPKRAMPLHLRAGRAAAARGMQVSLCISLRNYSKTCRLVGKLFESDATARMGLFNSRYRDEGRFANTPIDYFAQSEVAAGLAYGEILYAIGNLDRARQIARRVLRIQSAMALPDSYDLVELLSNLELANGNISEVERYGKLLNDWASEDGGSNGMAELVLGRAAFAAGSHPSSLELYREALDRMRHRNLIAWELDCRLEIADASVILGLMDSARDVLSGVWELAESGRFARQLSCACRIMSHVTQSDDLEASIDFAVQAFKHAWCDGPPFCYSRELQAAKERLTEFRVDPPSLEPFDPCKQEAEFVAAPDCEVLDPDDEFTEERINDTAESYFSEKASWQPPQQL